MPPKITIDDDGHKQPSGARKRKAVGQVPIQLTLEIQEALPPPDKSAKVITCLTEAETSQDDHEDHSDHPPPQALVVDQEPVAEEDPQGAEVVPEDPQEDPGQGSSVTAGVPQSSSDVDQVCNDVPTPIPTKQMVSGKDMIDYMRERAGLKKMFEDQLTQVQADKSQRKKKRNKASSINNPINPEVQGQLTITQAITKVYKRCETKQLEPLVDQKELQFDTSSYPEEATSEEPQEPEDSRTHCSGEKLW